MQNNTYYSWGRTSKCEPFAVYFPDNRNSQLCEDASHNILSIGNLRSYGDSCYNTSGLVINNKHLRNFIAFDRENGFLTAEAGILLKEILQLTVNCGWFVNVTPGTQFVTLGGAVANDVHGKNHHKDGSFGCFVIAFELVRSDGSRHVCSKEDNSELFYATIGGLGLTGWITWVQIKLLRIQSPAIITSGYKFAILDEYFALNTRLEGQNKYTVSWVDCAAHGKDLGRGIYFVGEHAGIQDNNIVHKSSKLSIPITPPISLINKLSLKMFNGAYYRQSVSEIPKVQHYENFFYPLDKILHWNRVYGRTGFYQYQCVVPNAGALDVMREILQQISKSGLGSFLAVLKTFGNKSSGGLMSFPREGLTLALDFANTGNNTHKLFKRLDDIIFASGGALYPAKDGRMSKAMFEYSYPNLSEFIKYVDPKFSSDLWRRIRNEK